LKAGGLLKITRLSGVPQFLHLATPEVMAFGKEFKIHQVFKTVLLGTSNSLVWGIDECSNTHHFWSNLNCKTYKNTQKCIKILKIFQNCVLYVLDAK
jgi:hypothetical protein